MSARVHSISPALTHTQIFRNGMHNSFLVYFSSISCFDQPHFMMFKNQFDDFLLVSSVTSIFWTYVWCIGYITSGAYMSVPNHLRIFTSAFNADLNSKPLVCFANQKINIRETVICFRLPAYMYVFWQ